MPGWRLARTQRLLASRPLARRLEPSEAAVVRSPTLRRIAPFGEATGARWTA